MGILKSERASETIGWWLKSDGDWTVLNCSGFKVQNNIRTKSIMNILSVPVDDEVITDSIRWHCAKNLKTLTQKFKLRKTTEISSLRQTTNNNLLVFIFVFSLFILWINWVPVGSLYESGPFLKLMKFMSRIHTRNKPSSQEIYVDPDLCWVHELVGYLQTIFYVSEQWFSSDGSFVWMLNAEFEHITIILLLLLNNKKTVKRFDNSF